MCHNPQHGSWLVLSGTFIGKSYRHLTVSYTFWGWLDTNQATPNLSVKSTFTMPALRLAFALHILLHIELRAIIYGIGKELNPIA